MRGFSQPLTGTVAEDPKAGPAFCGGDLTLLDARPGERFDLESIADFFQRGYGEGTVMRGGTIVTRLYVKCPEEELQDIWLTGD